MENSQSPDNPFADWEPAETRHFRQREVVFRQGDTVRYLYSVAEGQVRLERDTVEGKKIVLHTAGPGQSFPDAALFADRYHCNAVASLPSLVRLYPRDQVLETLRNDWQAAQRFIATLSRQVRMLRTRLELRNILSARDRILQYLFLRASHGDTEMDLPYPLKDLSSELGLAHETLYRELASLEKDGIIQRDGRRIKILRADQV